MDREMSSMFAYVELLQVYWSSLLLKRIEQERPGTDGIPTYSASNLQIPLITNFRACNRPRASRFGKIPGLDSRHI